jgi:hypothetical protein
MMKLSRLGVFIGSLFMAQLVGADTESEREAEKLLTTMGMEEVM